MHENSEKKYYNLLSVYGKERFLKTTVNMETQQLKMAQLQAFEKMQLKNSKTNYHTYLSCVHGEERSLKSTIQKQYI